MQWAVKAYHHAETYFNVSKICLQSLANKKELKPIICPALTRGANAEYECRVQIPVQMCIVDGMTDILESLKKLCTNQQ